LLIYYIGIERKQKCYIVFLNVEEYKKGAELLCPIVFIDEKLQLDKVTAVTVI